MRGDCVNVTSKGRYALRVMMDLAQHPEDGFVSLKTVAERQDIYKLNRAPADYTVGEILRSIEDNLAPVSCIKAGSIQCDRAAECLTLPMWKELDDITNAYLDKVSLQDLLSGDKWKPIDKN